MCSAAIQNQKWKQNSMPRANFNQTGCQHKQKFKSPSEYKKQYEELILKHHDQDIGRAEHFEITSCLRTINPDSRSNIQHQMHINEVEAQIQDWLRMSIIQPSTSRCNSSMFLVPKNGLLEW
jgi:hypothetical protein